MCVDVAAAGTIQSRRERTKLGWSGLLFPGAICRPSNSAMNLRHSWIAHTWATVAANTNMQYHALRQKQLVQHCNTTHPHPATETAVEPAASSSSSSSCSIEISCLCAHTSRQDIDVRTLGARRISAHTRPPQGEPTRTS